MGKVLTAGELRNFLKNVPPDTEITFGSSKHRQRPLVFYRFKWRADDLLQIELNELDDDINKPVSEIDCRPTVERFMEQLAGVNDEVEINFGTSLDAVPLEFRNVEMVVGINLEQTDEKPRWKVSGGVIYPSE